MARGRVATAAACVRSTFTGGPSTVNVDDVLVTFAAGSGQPVDTSRQGEKLVRHLCYYDSGQLNGSKETPLRVTFAMPYRVRTVQADGPACETATIAAGIAQAKEARRAPWKLEEADFHVDIVNGPHTFTSETVVGRKWLTKSLKQGLVVPALKAHLGKDHFRESMLENMALTITVGGIEHNGLVDTIGLQTCEYYARPMGHDVPKVTITLSASVANAMGGAVFHVFVDDTGLTHSLCTSLSSRNLQKSLKAAVIEPALKDYCAKNKEHMYNDGGFKYKVGCMPPSPQRRRPSAVAPVPPTLRNSSEAAPQRPIGSPFSARPPLSVAARDAVRPACHFVSTRTQRVAHT
jgi:hypothetical protein